jgi:hypothetical protein
MVSMQMGCIQQNCKETTEKEEYVGLERVWIDGYGLWIDPMG